MKISQRIGWMIRQLHGAQQEQYGSRIYQWIATLLTCLDSSLPQQSYHSSNVPISSS